MAQCDHLFLNTQLADVMSLNSNENNKPIVYLSNIMERKFSRNSDTDLKSLHVIFHEDILRKANSGKYLKYSPTASHL